VSLRTRWAATLAAVAAVAVGLAMGLSMFVTQSQLRRQVDDELIERAKAAQELRDVFREGRPGRRPVGRLFGPDTIVQVVFPDGRVAGFEDQPRLPTDDVEVGDEAVLRTVTVEGVAYRMISAPAGDGLVTVQIAVDATSGERSLAALRRRLLLVWLTAATAAGVVGWLLAGRAVAPIGRLTEAAELVARTDRLDVDLDRSVPGEVGRLAAAFSSMLETLRRSREQQARLASDAGHELRTPLTALRTNLETLRRSGDRISATDRTELLDAAIVEVGELSILSTELVDLATDPSRSDEPPHPVDLGDLVDRVAERYRRRSGRTIDVAGTGAEVVGREAGLERALSNLVDNAVKWSPPEGPIEVTVDGGQITVSDRGPGFAPEDLAHVFERFYRSAEARTTLGSGLGLAIVEHVITAHGGTVFARNREGGGAEVGFELPA
jgi:two-component system sensor histidine kinase MprB